MVHIVDGALSDPVMIGGACLAVAGVAAGVRNMSHDDLPRVGLMSAAFFVCSTLVHVPAGVSSAHLLLTGVMGLVLGIRVFPALLVALFLQAAFFGFGGFGALGVNVLVLAIPACLCHMAVRPLLARSRPALIPLLGGLAGLFAVALTGVLVALVLVVSGEEFQLAAGVMFASQTPLMLIEGPVSAAIVAFIARLRPDMLGISSPEMPDRQTAHAVLAGQAGTETGHQ